MERTLNKIMRYFGTIVMIFMAVVCSTRGFQSLDAGQPYEMMALMTMSRLFIIEVVLVNTRFKEM